MRGARVVPRVLAALALAAAASACAPPIVCPPGHVARHERLCPPCSESHPCECSEAWTCREAEGAEAQEARARLAAQYEAALTRAEAISRERAAAWQREAASREKASTAASTSTATIATEPPEAAMHPFPEAPGAFDAACDGSCGGLRTRVHVACTTENAAPRVVEFDCGETPPSLVAPCASAWEVSRACLDSLPPPPARPPCRAPVGRCCMEDGSIVTPCGPGPARPGCQGGACGSGTTCSGCR